MVERPLHLWSTSSRARLFTGELPGATPGSLPQDLAARACLCSAALTPAPCSAMEDAPRAQVPARPSAPARAPMSMSRSQCRAPAASLSLSMAAESLCARLAPKFVPAAPCSDPLPLRGSRLSAQLAPTLLSRRSPASVCHASRRFSLTRAPPCRLPARRGIPAFPSSERVQSPARRARSSSLRTRRAQPCPYARCGRFPTSFGILPRVLACCLSTRCA
jgi:hypothetical protein|uniref:Uncharacterized protein n=1 Tax=Zea mays TaxID=4577 RepID=A0A804MKI0_MAIZE